MYPIRALKLMYTDKRDLSLPRKCYTLYSWSRGPTSDEFSPCRLPSFQKSKTLS